MAFPNPARNKVRFLFHLSTGGEVTIVLYNVQGERVGSIVKEMTAGRGRIIVWDCASVSPGIYLAKVTVPGRGASVLRVAVIR